MRKRVLLVDDNPDNLELLFLALGTDHYEICSAQTAAEAYALLAIGAFDLALLDVELPDGSGLKIARKMRQRSSSTVILMFSAIDDPEALSQGAAVGANAYVVKPFDLLKVLALIEDINAQVITATSKMKVVKG